MVNIKIAASLVVVASAAVPIFAVPIDSTSDLETREPNPFFIKAARRLIGLRRDLDETGIEAREPKRHRLSSSAGRFAGNLISGALNNRDLPEEEIEAREPKRGHRRHHRKHRPALVDGGASLSTREFSEVEVEAREPKKHHHHHRKHRKSKKHAPVADSPPSARELEEIDARGVPNARPGQGSPAPSKPAPGTNRPHARDLEDVEEINARGVRIAGPGQGSPAPSKPAPATNRPHARDLEDVEEIDARGIRIAGPPAPSRPAPGTHRPHARDLEDVEDLLARFFDEVYDLD